MNNFPKIERSGNDFITSILFTQQRRLEHDSRVISGDKIELNYCYAPKIISWQMPKPRSNKLEDF